MIASIILLQRLPKNLHEFDYLVPESIEKDIELGQIVEIPFRKSVALGLVFKLKNQTTEIKVIKEIMQIINLSPLLSVKEIEFLKKISCLYGVSTGVLAKMSLPPLQKNKLKKAVIKKLKITKQKQQKKKLIYFLYSTQKEHAKFLEQKIKGQTIILVPEQYLIDEVWGLLPPKLQVKTVRWHSELSQKEQFETWLNIRNKEKMIIISTRGGVFLPIHGLNTIIIDYEHDENHKHWDQTPRFHTKDVAYLLAKETNAQLYLTSYSPSAESYFALHKHQCNGIMKLKPVPIEIIDMRAEHRAQNYGIFAEKTLNYIKQQKEKDILILINRLGFATGVSCHMCGKIETCTKCFLPLVFHKIGKTMVCHFCQIQKQIPTVCSSCRSATIKLHGYGTETVAESVTGLLEKYQVIRVDSLADVKVINSEQKKIIVGTEISLPLIRWDKIGLVIFLGIDQQLSIPEYLSGENAWNLIQKVLFYKSSSADLIIQTFNPKHVVWRSLTEPDRFFRTDLSQRKVLQYPPYVFLVRYFYGHEQKEKAKKEIEKIRQSLCMELTKEKKSINISSPIAMHPLFYRGKYWYCLIVRLQLDSWMLELAWLNQFIPENCKIDPHPISILSP